MKALILAAGRGTRMGRLTDNIPKPLIRINNHMFLDYLLRDLREAGADDIAIIVGYKKEMLIDTLSNRDLKITFIEQEEQLGTGHAIKISKDWADNEDFIVVMGDNLYSPADIRNACKDDEFCYVAGYESQAPEEFGVLVPDGNMLEAIIEKPSNPPSNLINTGLYKLTPEIFNALENIRKSDRGEYEVTDAISFLCKRKRVKFISIAGYWLNLGSPEDIPFIEKFMSQNNIRL